MTKQKYESAVVTTYSVDGLLKMSSKAIDLTNIHNEEIMLSMMGEAGWPHVSTIYNSTSGVTTHYFNRPK